MDRKSLVITVLFLTIPLAAGWPLVVKGQEIPVRRVNAPGFEGEVRYDETAIFWFGRITPDENYADVRIGYNSDHLFVNLAVFDRRLWYAPTPTPANLLAYDAISLYLDLDGNQGTMPDTSSYRFDAQLVWWEARDGYQAAYRGDGTRWVNAAVPFTSVSGWRGNAPNDDQDDRGWTLSYYIPFDSLGLSGPPTPGTIWALALELHDRDDANGTPIPVQAWPTEMQPEQPASWGQLRFGVPSYDPSAGTPVTSVTIRQGLDGATVPDAHVGGDTVCGGDLDYWSEWGQANYTGQGHFNIQNQADVADWPCFSKYYVTFPLDSLPAGRTVISATLTLHKFGQAGGPEEAQPSWIQVLSVGQDWDEGILNWNNAPLATENVSGAWVDPVPFTDWPGEPFHWDVTAAASAAYDAAEPLRLALYEADSAYHSGKYFVSSDSSIEEGRPTLTITLGQSRAVVHKTFQPLTQAAGRPVSVTLSVTGNGLPLTLTDLLPPELSAPGGVRGSAGSLLWYDKATHRLTWSGSLAAGQSLNFAFPVTVQVPGPTVISNTAVLTDSAGHTSSSTARLVVDPQRVWLPLLIQQP